VNESSYGRGQLATTDMKARIAALRRQGVNDIVAVLWERNREAHFGGGYTYEFAEQVADEVRPTR
jgi:hypothetical protein